MYVVPDGFDPGIGILLSAWYVPLRARCTSSVASRFPSYSEPTFGVQALDVACTFFRRAALNLAGSDSAGFFQRRPVEHRR
jgi:hypothetical protein